jgi:hypothetical protein
MEAWFGHRTFSNESPAGEKPNGLPPAGVGLGRRDLDPLCGHLRDVGRDRRTDTVEILRTECSAWEHQRNEQAKGVDWRFTAADTRIKLKRLYPQTQM